MEDHGQDAAGGGSFASGTTRPTNEGEGGRLLRDAVADRDGDLDDFRAMALVWVLLVHCLYWLPLLPGPAESRWKSLALAEMPIIFFVAGAANALRRPGSALAFIASRWRRILIPYWIYLAAAILLSLAMPGGLGRMGQPRPSWALWIVGLRAPDLAWPVLAFHLWFIPVYLASMLIFPALQRLRAWCGGRGALAPLVPLAAFVAVADAADVQGMARPIGFYAFWLYLGLCRDVLRSAIPSKAGIAALAALAYGTTIALVATPAFGGDFQRNKFPPNLAFLSLSLGHFSALSLVAPYLLRVARSRLGIACLGPYRRYGYTIYLWHPLVFAGLASIIALLWPRPSELTPALRSSLVLVSFALAAALAPRIARPFAGLETRRPAPRALRPG